MNADSFLCRGQNVLVIDKILGCKRFLSRNAASAPISFVAVENSPPTVINNVSSSLLMSRNSLSFD